MNLRWYLAVFLLVFAIESSRAVWKYRNSAPQVGDAAEVHNIGYNLAHGRGYIFDWNDANWRKLWQAQNTDGRFDFIVVRRGSYPTMSRPPLMPILMAGVIRLFPHNSFVAWRVVDSAAFAAAVCLLCEVVFVHGGFAGLIVMLSIVLGDRWRRDYIPGWWTEGLAFDFLSVIVWLLANPRMLRPGVYYPVAGLAVGLLCLDRTIFTLLIPPLCLLLAIAYSKPGRSRAESWRGFLAILALSVLIQMPWWVRNIAVSGRFMPLGTQGGYNLPDEYGDMALAKYGLWTGRGIRNEWAAVHPASNPMALPPGMTPAAVLRLWPYDVNDRAEQSLLVANLCTSLESEIAVSNIGSRAAVRWIKTNYYKIPLLMVEKAWSLTYYLRLELLIATAIGVIGYRGLPGKRRMIAHLIILMGIYLLAIIITHVVYVRFIMLIFPAMYVVVTLGVVVIVQYVGGKFGSRPTVLATDRWIDKSR